MPYYGVLKSSTNTGLDSELAYVFATPLNVIDNAPAYVSDTLSLKRKTNSQKVQRWEIEADIVATTGADVSKFTAHSVKYGVDQSFYLRMPQMPRTDRISEATSVLTSGSHLAGASNVTLNNANMVIGEFINFAGHDKVYMIVGKSGSIVEIKPALVSNVGTGIAVAFGSKCKMRAKYNTDSTRGMRFEDGVLSNPGTISFIEDL